MDVFEAIHRRRSVRNFTGDPVVAADLEKIVAAGIEAPSGCNMQLRQYVIVDDPAVMDKLRPLSGAIDGAPAAIVLLVDPQPTRYGEFWIQDASAAMENMLLAAEALGYGACWVEGALRRCEETLRELLGVPANLRVWSLMSVGRAAKTPPRPAKSEFAQVVHRNRFGERFRNV
ncbi:MAG TPA: nitroreductase family protein [Phycisphaerae bacterium]|nr:nitroreductase family protein [Phycisphaerae bacterium]